MPSVRPRNSCRRGVLLPRQLPAATVRCWRTSWREAASASRIACSETAVELAPPLLQSGTPARRAESRSAWSYPALSSWISLRLGPASNSASSTSQSTKPTRYSASRIASRYSALPAGTMESSKPEGATSRAAVAASGKLVTKTILGCMDSVRSCGFGAKTVVAVPRPVYRPPAVCGWRDGPVGNSLLGGTVAADTGRGAG